MYGAANRAYRDYHGLANYDGPGGGENYYWFRCETSLVGEERSKLKER